MKEGETATAAATWKLAEHERKSATERRGRRRKERDCLSDCGAEVKSLDIMTLVLLSSCGSRRWSGKTEQKKGRRSQVTLYLIIYPAAASNLYLLTAGQPSALTANRKSAGNRGRERGSDKSKTHTNVNIVIITVRKWKSIATPCGASSCASGHGLETLSSLCCCCASHRASLINC